MRVVLLPVDIAVSRERFPAIDVARDLVGERNPSFIVNHVIQDVPIEHIPYEQRESAISRVKFEALERLNQLVRLHELPDTSECVVRQGNPARQIAKLAIETQADLIVMESHNPGIADYLIGSVSAGVVRHARCSVYIVRDLP